MKRYFKIEIDMADCGRAIFMLTKCKKADNDIAMTDLEYATHRHVDMLFWTQQDMLGEIYDKVNKT